MNIYDEALNGLEAIRKELQDRLNFPVNLTHEYRSVKKALERAKKVEELFELYQEKDGVTKKYTKNSFSYLSELERLSYEISIKEKELEELK